jgi:putative transposase
MDVLVLQGSPETDLIRQIGLTEVTYWRWRQEYGGLTPDQVKWLKMREPENTGLRKAVTDLTLNKLILKEAVPKGAPR